MERSHHFVVHGHHGGTVVLVDPGGGVEAFAGRIRISEQQRRLHCEDAADVIKQTTAGEADKGLPIVGGNVGELV